MKKNVGCVFGIMKKSSLRVSILALILMLAMPSSLFAAQVYRAKEYEVPVSLRNYHEDKESMGAGALRKTARVVEKNGKMTYFIYTSQMLFTGLEGGLTNFFVYDDKKGGPRIEALKQKANIAEQNTMNGKSVPFDKLFSFTRTANRENEIEIAVWVDVMDAIASPNGKVKAGAAEQSARLKFDWKNARQVKTKIEPSSLSLVVNGCEVFSDTAPYVDANSRTMVPLRLISEALGMKVGWEGSTRTVTIGEGSAKLSLKIGSSKITKDNGKVITIDTAAVIKNGRAMVPVRAIVELSGANVKWEGSTRTVQISK